MSKKYQNDSGDKNSASFLILLFCIARTLDSLSPKNPIQFFSYKILCSSLSELPISPKQMLSSRLLMLAHTYRDRKLKFRDTKWLHESAICRSRSMSCDWVPRTVYRLFVKSVPMQIILWAWNEASILIVSEQNIGSRVLSISKIHREFGYSCHMPVPAIVAEKLCDGSGLDLEQIMEWLWEKPGIGDRDGSFGVWSANMITRTDQFRLATQCALVPFFSRFYSLQL